MTKAGVETPLRIGARNPFAYAEYKLRKKIDWEALRPAQKREKLEEAFGMPYDQLFDPRTESPLFVKTGDMRPCAPVLNPTWGPNPDGSNYTITSRVYNDPVQGDLPDCYFIAALSSLAFLKMIPDKQLDTSGYYSFTFYNPPAEAPVPTAPVKITLKHPLDSSGKYHYSKSITKGEIWIAMYEKAFASWVGSKTDTPDYSKICQGDPMLALMNMTGWKYKSYIKTDADPDPVTSSATRYATQDFSDGTKIYTKIKNACNSAGPYYIAKFPMVAYTHDPRILPAPSGGYPPYTDATIVGNHAYSVLGVFPNDYIVMRNPWGQRGAGPGMGDPDPTGLPADALASGTWYGGFNLADSSDAVFGLKASVFRTYFKGFGWVYQ
jgi:hypothetical protein